MNLNFDNKAWMLIFIVGFVMVLLTSKCLCNSENFASITLNDGKTNNEYTILYDKTIGFHLGNSKNVPLQIDGNNIIITVTHKIKTIRDLYNILSESKTSIMMTYKNKDKITFPLVLNGIKKIDKNLNNSITISSATFERSNKNKK